MTHQSQEEKQALTNKYKTRKPAIPDSRNPETRFLLSKLQLHVEVLGHADIYSEDTEAVDLQPTTQSPQKEATRHVTNGPGTELFLHSALRNPNLKKM